MRNYKKENKYVNICSWILSAIIIYLLYKLIQ